MSEVTRDLAAARREWRDAIVELDRLNAKLDSVGTPDVIARASQQTAKCDALRARVQQLENDEQRQNATIRDARLLVTDHRNAENEKQEAMNRGGSPAGGSHARVTSEPLTYEKHGEHSYFRDLYAATRTGDLQARSRLERHQREMRVERRDLSSTDGVGGDFVPPLWIMDEWVPASRAARPFANVVRQLPLPPNTDSINIPKVLTGSAVSAHADLGAVQETDPTTGTVSVPVKTLAGQVDLARQVFDRGLPGMDVVVFGDLVADYNLRLDLQLLVGSGSGANAKGILSDSNRVQISYTDASPTVGEFYSKIADAAQQVFGQIYRPATHVILHPRRWAWITAASDSTGRPLVSPVAGQNSPGTFGITNEGVVGSLQGLTVVLDANLPVTGGAGTNEDTVIVTRAQELMLFELPGGPVTRVFEEVLSGSLAVRLQAYGYFAFSSERLSKATATINGTGLTSPVL